MNSSLSAAAAATGPVPSPSSDTRTADAVVARAHRLLVAALTGETGAERREGTGMARLVQDPSGKQFTVRMADEVFRSHRTPAQADRLQRLAAALGLPAWLPATQRLLLRVAVAVSRWLPGIVMPAVERQLRQDSRKVILSAEPDDLRNYLATRRTGGARVNVNQLGEAILGEDEAGRRLQAILTHLENPEINYISVKLSAIFSRIQLTAWRATLDAVKHRLRLLYRAAIAHPVPGPDGMPAAKFVNLDMEEYRDLALTMTAFREVLDEPEFARLTAGIVLQAYLPDSWQALQDLTAWAAARHAAHGGKIKIRLVKGANLAMELVEAELHDWTPAPYATKGEVDANYRRMLEYALDAKRPEALRIGVASHNLFDLSLALTLAETQGTSGRMEIEMLEGMAPHQARAVSQEAGGILFYAPVVKRADFLSAMAYLVRRLDENTAPGNFLHDLFSLTPGSPAWQAQEAAFRQGWHQRHAAATAPRRTQNRQTEQLEDHLRETSAPFHNEADTDWALPANREWADAIRERWTGCHLSAVPLQVAGSLHQTLHRQDVCDPSTPGDVICQACLAGPEEVDAALAAAAAFLPVWSARSPDDRAGVLLRCAAVLATRRGEAMGCMMRETGKALTESDGEVSEAIDFARWYARAFADAAPWLEGATGRPLGVVVVTPPWNFPFAIPCGGVLAALMAGSTVILKPAPEAILTGWTLANALWDAGVPREALQFLPCPDNDTGRALLTDPRTATVILTGAWSTAQLFRSWRPDMNLLAETSGKNALIVTAQADRDLAVKDLVRSAFGHAGQKCSAASLAILEAEVYDDPLFRQQLRDAAASLLCGPAWDPSSVVTPLITPPGPDLFRALTTLEPGEEWLLEPRPHPDNSNLWSPGIRLGVKPGSWFHRTECFGPVLGLMRATSLEEAITWQNDSVYGLTAGLHSLDEAEATHWRSRVQAGNAYINRPITGAIVQRQPFGGWKRSSIGPGAKAGGPNYVFALMDWQATDSPDRQETARQFPQAWAEIFAVSHDPTGLRSESNAFRYVPCREVILRLNGQESADDLALCALAATTAGVSLTVSSPPGDSAAPSIPGLPGIREDLPALVARLAAAAAAGKADTIRTLTPVDESTARALAGSDWRWIAALALANPRLELLRWTREQAISETRHRYGNPRPR